MPNPFFQFKQFTVYHDKCAMKVTTDACLFGAWCAEQLAASSSSLKVLDIGTGSGLLSLMVSQQNRFHIDAVEIDTAAAQQAEENIRNSPFSEAITIINSDILNFKEGGYDVIISNPPFYEHEIPSAQQQKNIAHHSEALKLEALFPIIKDKLTDTGCFYLLLPFKRKAAIDRLLVQAGLYVEKEIILRSSAAHPPFRLLLKGSTLATSCTTETIAIYTAEKQYTPEFTALLKAYYLYL